MFTIKMKKHQSRGVSEIVASVLMIAIVAAAGTGILLYSTGYFTGITSARDMADSQNLNALREHFTISDAIVKSDGNVSASIYNFGEINVKIVGLYVNGVPYTMSPQIIRPNQSNWTYSIGAPISANLTFVTVRVVSSLGNYYEEFFVPE